jgi:AcrR family transcriptional regulator
MAGRRKSDQRQALVLVVSLARRLVTRMSVSKVAVPAASKAAAAAGRRRRPAEMRAQALQAGRALLIAHGPDGVTLTAVGAALGVTHANVLHHFGSARGFQAALMNAMVTDLTDHVTEILARPEIDLATIVEETFAAYDQGGIGKLMAWVHLTGDGTVNGQLAAAIGRLVSVVRRQSGDTVDAGAQVGVLSMLAFACSVMGPELGRLVDIDPSGFRAMTVRIMALLAKAG